MHELILLAQKIGYLGLFAIIFFESFPVTLFLPGDSLLFTTGFLASLGYFRMDVLVGTLFVAAVLGYIFSYAMGDWLVKRFFTNRNSVFFNQKHIDYTKKFFDKYGAKAIIMGRFVPIVRSFAPTIAGAVQVEHKRFLKYTLVGGFLWAGGMTSVGFYLGKAIPNADHYITPIILLIIFLSVLPSVIEYLLTRRKNTDIESIVK